MLILVLTTALTLPAAAPTFSADIAPILARNCTSCHYPGGPGPFSLLTYSDAKKHARQIVTVTRTRYMPPWPPSPDSGPFEEERRLSDREINVIVAWANANTPEGQPSANPAASDSAEGGWRLGTPDLVLTTAHPLKLSASGPDVFWNFVFHPELVAGRYVRAIEIRPGQSRLVHHANLLLDRTGTSARLEKAAGGAGFPGMDLNLSRNPLDPESHFLFWKPGSVPYSEPPGLAWRLNPGNLLVLNTHLQTSGKPEDVAPSVGLYFTDQPPTKFPILVQLENDRALRIPPGVRDFVVTDSLTLPADADLLAIYPHAHYLGTLLDGFATLPDGTRRRLIQIPHWDLNWQAVYRFRTPVFLPKGTTVAMRYHYDNSAANIRNPNHPPRMVQSGNQASDEMGHLWLQLLPRGPGDRRRPFQEAIARHRVARDPNDATAHLSLGAILLSRLRAQEAIPELRAVARLEPNRPEAHDMLGAALQNTGQLQAAIAEYRLALAVQPDYVSARYNLALALVRAGQPQKALPELRRVMEAFPNDARIRQQYQELQARTR